MRKLIDTLESRIGHWAIPSLLRTLTLLHVMSWGVLKLQPKVAQWLDCDLELIMHGEVWRTVSWVFLPESMSLLYIVFGTMFMWWMGGALEEMWGAFRVNLYVLAGVLCGVAAVILSGGNVTASLLWTSVLFAFAAHFPNEEIMLFPLPIPIKIKWMAWVVAALLALRLIGAPSAYWPMLVALLHFFITFGSDFIQGSAQQLNGIQRKQRFAATQLPNGAALHTCARCGKTDANSPLLEFRVNAEGEDVCSECRK
jgi:membrane associated rhomboid family serine protease